MRGLAPRIQEQSLIVYANCKQTLLLLKPAVGVDAWIRGSSLRMTMQTASIHQPKTEPDQHTASRLLPREARF